ncbi:hypothetical protein KAU11_11015 [Candidatus Babeliales bacterium]|nr:hypothetical protein [Candidatus Babeliales bacterium]
MDSILDHKWDKWSQISSTSVSLLTGSIKLNTVALNGISINRKDAIEIAKYFNLTTNDLDRKI